MKTERILICTIAITLAIPYAYAQERMELDEYCTFSGERLADEVFTFTSDQEASRWINKITKYSGLEPNFRIAAANVGNALATIKGEERVILYDQNFMREMNRQSGTDWAAISILAHEIGHHLQGHTLRRGGSRPNQELEADKFSGFILARMDATLDQARAAMQTMRSPGSETHPPSTARLAAITNGWRAAEELKDELKTAKKDTEKSDPPAPQARVTQTPSPTQPLQQPTTQNPTPNIVAHVIVYNDNNRYFLTADGSIMAVVGLGQNPSLYGRQLPSNSPQWAWMMQTPRGIFPVDRAGIIVGQNPQTGQLFRLGHVASL